MGAPRARSSRRARLSEPRWAGWHYRPRPSQHLGEQRGVAGRAQARKALRIVLTGRAMRRVQVKERDADQQRRVCVRDAGRGCRGGSSRL